MPGSWSQAIRVGMRNFLRKKGGLNQECVSQPQKTKGVAGGEKHASPLSLSGVPLGD